MRTGPKSKMAPAVLLMAIVAFHAEALLFDEVHEVLQHPAWVALVLIGFIKETALPFLAAFLAVLALILEFAPECTDDGHRVMVGHVLMAGCVGGRVMPSLPRVRPSKLLASSSHNGTMASVAEAVSGPHSPPKKPMKL